MYNDTQGSGDPSGFVVRLETQLLPYMIRCEEKTTQKKITKIKKNIMYLDLPKGA